MTSQIMEETQSFASLLLVISLAFLVPVTLSRFKRFRLPIVVGEILVGILVGTSGLGWVNSHDPVLNLLAEFGFVFLMFLSGMEIDFSNLSFSQSSDSVNSDFDGERLFWGPIQIGAALFLLSLVLSAAISFGMAQMGLVQSPWMMTLILSTTSLGVVLPVLKEKGLSSGQFGQTLLIAALIADFVTMLLITIFVTILSLGLTLEILLVGILFLAFIFMYRFGLFFSNRMPGARRMIEELSGATSQIKMRAAFTLMLIFVVLSEALGVELILGAFLAGAIVSLLKTPEDEELSLQLEAIGFGFFIPIFFIMVGVNFNLATLFGSPEALLLLPILLLAAFFVKMLLALLFRLQFTWPETLSAGALLSARLSLIIAASAIGLQLGLVSEQANAAIILVAILTVTTAPLLFTKLFPEDEMPASRPIIVVGAGQFGLQVAGHLLDHHERVVVIDADPERIKKARMRNLEAVAGCIAPGDENVALYLNKAKTLICTVSDTEEKFRICQAARVVFGINRVITLLADPAESPRFSRLGVKTITLDLDWAAFVAVLARNPLAYELLTRTDDHKELREVTMRNPRFAGKHLHEMTLPGDVRVLALRRNGDLIVPGGYTQLFEGDSLSLVGMEDCIEEARQIFREHSL